MQLLLMCLGKSWHAVLLVANRMLLAMNLHRCYGSQTMCAKNPFNGIYAFQMLLEIGVGSASSSMEVSGSMV